MSNYIQTIHNKQFMCIDDYFWNHRYWYVEKTKWVDWGSFEKSKVMNEIEFNDYINKNYE